VCWGDTLTGEGGIPDGAERITDVESLVTDFNEYATWFLGDDGKMHLVGNWLFMDTEYYTLGGDGIIINDTSSVSGIVGLAKPASGLVWTDQGDLVDLNERSGEAPSVLPVKNVVKVVSGYLHEMALLQDGSVVMLRGTQWNVPPTNLGKVRDIAAFSDVTWVQCVDGSLFAWDPSGVHTGPVFSGIRKMVGRFMTLEDGTLWRMEWNAIPTQVSDVAGVKDILTTQNSSDDFVCVC
jgi:hypothetical protein